MSCSKDVSNPFIRLDLAGGARVALPWNPEPAVEKSGKPHEPVAAFRVKRHDIVVRESMRCHPKN